MNLAPFLLEIVSCPETHHALTIADGSLLERLNVAIDKGKLKDRAGDVVTPRLQGALLRADKQVVYPVWDDTPRLLVDSAIFIDQLR